MSVRISVSHSYRRGVLTWTGCNARGICHRFDTRTEARRHAFGR